MRSDVQAERQEPEILSVWWNMLERAAAVDTGERSSNTYSSGGWGRAARLRGRTWTRNHLLQRLPQPGPKEEETDVWIPPGLGFRQKAATEDDAVKKRRTLPRID